MKIKNLTITFFILLFSTQLFAEINEVNNNKIKILMESGVPLIDIRTE
ncbi:MAG TPA: sulfurtransferase, partial [Deltaproteobacteria bacterium]|nr:sulfurtransferase [Deltaproteobacteria bacterium]